MSFSLFLAPLVIARRLPRLWWEAMGGNPFGPRESVTMVSEKLAAMTEGALAAQRIAVTGAMEAGMDAMRGDVMGAAERMRIAQQRSLVAAMRPAARRVKGNLARLRRG